MRLLRRHLDEVGMTYVTHLLGALRFSVLSATAACLLLIHAFFPFLFVSTGSTIIKNIKNEMVHNDSNT